MNALRWTSAFLCSLLAISVSAAEPESKDIEFFEKKIRPVLIEHCYKCHSAEAEKLKGELHVDSRDGLLAGGDSGPSVVPGKPEKSKLIEAVTYKNIDLQMPKTGKLPDAVIADLTAWVKMGAPWPGKAEPAKTVKSAFDIEKRKREHWSWTPILEPAVPQVKDRIWPLSSSDRFIQAKLEAKGITPAKPAEGHVLLRRISFDLVGLPPTSEEIGVFEKEYAAEPQVALERVVDRLLASPQFGERWARHWLDLVRYGESRGHEFDPTIPNAWQYRDYVIRALNADLPYNQFVTEHLAGDLMPKPRLNKEAGFNESILGSGFWFLGEEVHSPVDIRADEADRFDNRIDVMTKTFLGLTVSCARCHDHKFDAIATKDYYALYGFLRSSNYRLVRFDSLEQNKKIGGELAELRDRYTSILLKTYSENMQPTIDLSADYLLAAREIIARNGSAEVTSPSTEKNLEKIAIERKLDPKRLASWALHLMRAAKEPADPMHYWAKMGDDVQLRLSILEAGRQQAVVSLSKNDAEIIIDYARSRPEDWLPDDVTFGTRPVRIGDLRFSNDTARPIAKVFDFAAAEKDPTWNGLKNDPGSQFDAVALGYNRAGWTIHTPSFAIKTGKVYYLVKGKGKAYVSVDGHIIIAGPLHGSLIHSFNTGDKFQWIEQNLTAYKDHRAHLEFTAESPEFSVSIVAQGETLPKHANVPANLFLPVLEKSGSAKEIASDYQQQFSRVANLFLKNDLHAVEDARLADWMIHHPELFVDEKSIEKVALPFLEAQAKLIKQIKTESRLALAMQDGSPVDETVFIRGSHKAPGEVVPRRLLQSLAGTKGIESKAGSGRFELAQQMIDPTLNPYITRIAVNRVWHHLFGRGIVGSTDNFGVLGERPTHPELLDHLAIQFAKEGWSTKKLIRSLILSRAYQMSSHPDESADAADPENLLLHRMRLRRLEGEVIRDSLLSIAGHLNSQMYGPSIPVHLTPFLDGRGRPASGPIDGDGRRSLYTAVRRNFLSPMMLAFDTPSPFSTVGKRTVSNVPAQSLILMNDPLVHQMAETWGKKLAASPGTSKEKIASMYMSAFTRPPTEAESSDCLAFLEAQSKEKNAVKAWSDLAHVVFNVKEFIFLE